MKKVLLKTLFLVLFVGQTLIVSSQPFSNVKHVVVIGIDGLGNYGLENAETLNVDKLIAKGVFSNKASSVLPTSSSPNWASMIMGAPPRKHKVFGNNWKRDRLHGKSFCENPNGELWPTIFRLIREAEQDALVGCIVQWGGFNRLVEDSICDLKISPSSAIETTKEAIKFLSKRPRFTFIHLDDVDHAGHEYGHGTSEYYSEVTQTDSLVGLILDAMDVYGMTDETVVLITADHGGIGKGHWGFFKKVKKTPWIIAGPHIKNNVRLDKGLHIYDTPATLLYLMGIDPPECWIGKPLMAILKN